MGQDPTNERKLKEFEGGGGGEMRHDLTNERKEKK